MDHLQTRLEALEQQVQTLHHQTRTVTRRLRWWRGLAGGLLVLAVLTWALPAVIAQEDASANAQKGLAQRVAALEKLLKPFSRKGNDVFITGANLHLVNGLGRTDCGSEEEPIPDCPNGLGNLIVGYNEPRPPVLVDTFGSDNRTGSHNVVVGQWHNFSRFGGIVVGSANEISGDFASVSGGNRNRAGGRNTTVSGGTFNTAGQFNTATGDFATTVSGGSGNLANGSATVVSGGQNNTAVGDSTGFCRKFRF